MTCWGCYWGVGSNTEAVSRDLIFAALARRTGRGTETEVTPQTDRFALSGGDGATVTAPASAAPGAAAHAPAGWAGPARRTACRKEHGGARVPGLGHPLGVRAVAAEEAAPGSASDAAAGAGRQGSEPPGAGGR